MTERSPQPPGRLVLALQFWRGDRDLAMENARRIADNEPAFRDDVEFLFVARFDCPHDQVTVQHVAKKFRTSTHTTSRRGTGWPAGCNDVWGDLCQYAMGRVYQGHWADVKAMLTFEADCVPVQRDWVDQISAEWDRAAAQGKFIVGAFMPPPRNGPIGHINGNAMFAPDIARRVPSVFGCSPLVGWDAAHAALFEPHWFPSPLFTNYYRGANVTEKDICRPSPDGRAPVLVHGVKDRSVCDFADRVLRKGPAVD